MSETPAQCQRPRLARREELPALAAIERRVHRAPWGLAQFVECLDIGHEIWVMEETREKGVQAQAYAVVATVLDEASLLNLAVDAAWQGRGFGRLLLNFVLARARTCGARRMLLEVRPSNARAIYLYESSGFREVGRRRGYYSGPSGVEDALLYSAELA